jgi:prophage antirepressor-like protein
MEILDRKSKIVFSFFTGLDEMLECIREILKNRTPHLNGEKFLTNRDVCRMLNISARTLQEWKTGEIIPYIQLKGKILYRQSDIDKMLRNNYFTAG